MNTRKILARFLIWRVKHIKQQHFILILSLVVGLLSGLAAVLLKNAIHYTHYLLTHGFAKDSESYWYLVYPIIGILITYLYVRYFVKDHIGHGVSRILYAISKRNSRIKSHNNYSSMIASTFTIGFGGSVGSEAPIVLTGASIGSTLGRLLRMNYKTITLLVGCGAAGAIAGIFKAPLAGLVFTLEVLMIDLTMASIVPLLISAVTSASVAFFLMGKGVIFSYKIVDPFVLDNIPYLILLGVVTGFLSLLFTRGAMRIEKQFERIQHPGARILTGGVILSVLIFLFPPLYGEGYETIRALLSNQSGTLAHSTLFYFVQDNFWFFALYLLLILGFKVIAMAATTGSGGVGGIFAPTLFMGGVAGFLFARLINSFSFIQVSESNFALVGMGGLMAGVMHAPLTGIFLIAEITGGYGLFVPLMIVATISYLTIMPFEPHSIYTKRLARRGELITHHKDRAVLTLMRMGDVVEKDLKKVGPDQTLGDLVKVVSKSCRNIFPVVDEENMLVGIVLLDNIRDIMFNQEMYADTYVHELMIMPPSYVSSDENMDCVMKKFEETGAWNLPVIDDGKYVGFVSKSKIFNTYRTLLVQFSDE